MITVTLESRKTFSSQEEFDKYISQLKYVFGPDFARKLKSEGYATIKSDNAKTIGRTFKH